MIKRAILFMRLVSPILFIEFNRFISAEQRGDKLFLLKRLKKLIF